MALLFPTLIAFRSDAQRHLFKPEYVPLSPELLIPQSGTHSPAVVSSSFRLWGCGLQGLWVQLDCVLIDAGLFTSCHIFYSQRVVDIPDGTTKWAGLDGKSEKL